MAILHEEYRLVKEARHGEDTPGAALHAHVRVVPLPDGTTDPGYVAVVCLFRPCRGPKARQPGTAPAARSRRPGVLASRWASATPQRPNPLTSNRTRGRMAPPARSDTPGSSLPAFSGTLTTMVGRDFHAEIGVGEGNQHDVTAPEHHTPVSSCRIPRPQSCPTRPRKQPVPGSATPLLPRLLARSQQALESHLKPFRHGNSLLCSNGGQAFSRSPVEGDMNLDTGAFTSSIAYLHRRLYAGCGGDARRTSVAPWSAPSMIATVQ